MMDIIIGLILLIVFAAIGVYCLKHSSLQAPQGIIYLVVALVFLILAIVVGLDLAGISVGPLFSG